MGMGSVPPDGALEAELAALRARAYGADADIDGDPRALRRLAELEEWHAAMMAAAVDAEHPSAEPEGPAPGSSPAWTGQSGAAAPTARTLDRLPSAGATRGAESLGRLSRTRVGAIALGAAGVAAIAAVVAGVIAWTAPQPDASLRFTGALPGEQALRLADFARGQLVSTSSLRGFQPWGELEVWGAQSALGNRCLLIMEPSTDSLHAASCVPPPAQPIAEVYDVPVASGEGWHEGLPVGSVVRFVLEGDVVEVWVFEGVRPE